jgi:uncharacterized protein (DUF433 family)
MFRDRTVETISWGSCSVRPSAVFIHVAFFGMRTSSVEVHSIVPGDESDLHDEPHIEGSRITVRYVYSQVEERGLRPESVADRYDLDLADVHAALTYYHRNPEVMGRVEKRRERLSETTAEMTTLTPPRD